MEDWKTKSYLVLLLVPIARCRFVDLGAGPVQAVVPWARPAQSAERSGTALAQTVGPSSVHFGSHRIRAVSRRRPRDLHQQVGRYGKTHERKPVLAENGHYRIISMARRCSSHCSSTFINVRKWLGTFLLIFFIELGCNVSFTQVETQVRSSTALRITKAVTTIWEFFYGLRRPRLELKNVGLRNSRWQVFQMGLARPGQCLNREVQKVAYLTRIAAEYARSSVVSENEPIKTFIKWTCWRRRKNRWWRRRRRPADTRKAPVKKADVISARETTPNWSPTS